MLATTAKRRAGRLRPLAVTTAARVRALPDVPALSELVPGYEASNVNGVGVPAKTPADIIARLNAELNAILAEPATQARFADFGGAAMTGVARSTAHRLLAMLQHHGFARQDPFSRAYVADTARNPSSGIVAPNASYADS